MRDELKISVVIPTCNRPKQLRILLFCILIQTRNPDEIIVVDDHTRGDSTKEVLEDLKSLFRAKNIETRHVRNTCYQSLTVARNTGVKESTGDIVVFMDDDLIPYPTFIEAITEVFTSCDVLATQAFLTNFFERSSLFRRVFALALFILFRALARPTKNRLRCHYDYPVFLDRPVPCRYLYGACLAVRRSVFQSGIWFDERLLGRAPTEDFLFSSRLRQSRQDSMSITPHARCMHPNFGYYQRTRNRREFERSKLYRKYFLLQERGLSGVCLLHLEEIGDFVVSLMAPILRQRASEMFNHWSKFSDAIGDRLSTILTAESIQS